MKLYSVHVHYNENEEYERECECMDIDVQAETRALAETYALARHPDADSANALSEWNAAKQDWDDYTWKPEGEEK